MALGAFWPEDDDSTEAQLRCLNAPYGARRFLTGDQGWFVTGHVEVLMHLMALGAF